MTDKAFRQHKKRVAAILEDLLVTLGMAGHWNVGVEYVNGRHPESETNESDTPWAVMCVCTTKWDYLECAIRVFVEDIANGTDGEIQSSLLHELVHVLVSEMQEWRNADAKYPQSVEEAVKHEERVVVGLTQAMTRLALMAQCGQFKVLVNNERFKSLIE